MVTGFTGSIEPTMWVRSILIRSRKSVENFVARATRLYEQEPGEALAGAPLGLHVRRWVRWAGGAVTEPSVLTTNP